MRLATIRVNGATRAVRADGDTLTDLGEFLAAADWRATAAAATAATAPASIEGIGQCVNKVVKEAI